MSGNAPYTAGLAQGLKRTGHQVRVITAYPHYPWWQIRPGYEGHEMHEVVGDVPVHRLRPWVPRRQGLLQRVAMETLFGLQACINMAVNVRLMPAKGMTLPFVSYGGSSLISLALGMGFLVALTRKRPGTTTLAQKPPGTAPATIAGVMR